MDEAKLRQVVVVTAQSLLGIREGSRGHRQIVDGYNRHTPIPRGYTVKYTDDWCAVFVSYVGYACGLSDIIPPECGCEEQIRLFQKRDRWTERDDYTPRPGDLIYYNWEEVAGDNRGWSDHVGIVERVDGQQLTVIEGNQGNAVKRRQLQVGDRYIRGFGLPDYERKADRPTMPWYAADRAWAMEQGITDGNCPDEPATRAEVWVMMHRLAEKQSGLRG